MWSHVRWPAQGAEARCARAPRALQNWPRPVFLLSKVPRGFHQDSTSVHQVLQGCRVVQVRLRQGFTTVATNQILQGLCGFEARFDKVSTFHAVLK